LAVCSLTGGLWRAAFNARVAIGRKILFKLFAVERGGRGGSSLWERASCIANANFSQIGNNDGAHPAAGIIDIVQLINLPILLMMHSDERRPEIITHTAVVAAV
jgi:hypothetical protein